jgi:ketosteroid isomerase-like protein
MMQVTQGSFHVDVHAVLADDEHGVALVTLTAGRDGGKIAVHAADVMHLRDGQVTEVWAILADQYAFDELIG